MNREEFVNSSLTSGISAVTQMEGSHNQEEEEEPHHPATSPLSPHTEDSYVLLEDTMTQQGSDLGFTFSSGYTSTHTTSAAPATSTSSYFPSTFTSIPQTANSTLRGPSDFLVIHESPVDSARTGKRGPRAPSKQVQTIPSPSLFFQLERLRLERLLVARYPRIETLSECSEEESLSESEVSKSIAFNLIQLLSWNANFSRV